MRHRARLQAAKERPDHDVACRELAAPRLVCELQHATDVELVDEVNILIEGHLPVRQDRDVAVAHVVRCRRVQGRLGPRRRGPLAPVEAQDVAHDDRVNQAEQAGVRGIVAHEGGTDVASQVLECGCRHAANLAQVLEARAHLRSAAATTADDPVPTGPRECRVDMGEAERSSSRAGHRSGDHLLHRVVADAVPRTIMVGTGHHSLGR
mmetsp:Transcript_93201/g.290581  ORF Transcript_93201/g.290581 Transcript_93201/m.290581 type:complete len:208 (+) Transcript_93201:440-1063(+)